MNPLTITLPPETFSRVVSGEKRVVSHLRNRRIDRFFAAKSPDKAMINGCPFNISRIEIDLFAVHIHIT
jgi:hypothetical protein